MAADLSTPLIYIAGIITDMAKDGHDIPVEKLSMTGYELQIEKKISDKHTFRARFVYRIEENGK